MFDKTYPFKRGATYPDEVPKTFLCCRIYTFGTENGPYVVRAEELIANVFAIKFYPKCFRNSPRKYQLLTHFGNASRILGTCIKIMIDIKKHCPNASFGFQGASLVGESKTSTKRFNIYRSIFQAFFSPAEFTHVVKEKHSVYLILNQKELITKPTFLDTITDHLIASFHFEGKAEIPENLP